MQADRISQPCDCAEIRRNRRIHRGIICVVLGLMLLALGGWHVADLFLQPQLIGEPHNALGHWIARVFQASPQSAHSETQQMFGQLVAQLTGSVGYYIVIFGLMSIGWVLFQGGCQLLWRTLRKEPQHCPHCGSTR